MVAQSNWVKKEPPAREKEDRQGRREGEEQGQSKAREEKSSLASKSHCLRHLLTIHLLLATSDTRTVKRGLETCLLSYKFDQKERWPFITVRTFVILYTIVFQRL